MDASNFLFCPSMPYFWGKYKDHRTPEGLGVTRPQNLQLEGVRKNEICSSRKVSAPLNHSFESMKMYSNFWEYEHPTLPNYEISSSSLSMIKLNIPIVLPFEVLRLSVQLFDTYQLPFCS